MKLVCTDVISKQYTTTYYRKITDPPIPWCPCVFVFMGDLWTQISCQVTKVAGMCFALLRGLRKVLPLLPSHSNSLVVWSVILSRLDYWNALLLGATDYSSKWLFRVQTVAKLALNGPRRSLAHDALKELRGFLGSKGSHLKPCALSSRPCTTATLT